MTQYFEPQPVVLVDSNGSPYKAAVAVQVGPTGSRPTAATAGVGTQFYDTTLTKPIWSDGTNWRDAAGTIV